VQITSFAFLSSYFYPEDEKIQDSELNGTKHSANLFHSHFLRENNFAEATAMEHQDNTDWSVYKK